MDIGLNLYSIRNLIQTEKDFSDTACKLKDMGYSYMQYSGGPYDAQAIARVSKEAKMPVCLTHVPLDRILNDTEKLMEEHESFSCKNIGLGYFPAKTIVNEKEFIDAVARLNEAAGKMKKNGFSFLFHHHHSEFFKRNGITALEYIASNAPNIDFTFDTYWVQYGGMDILSLLEKLSGRVSCVHLKDYKLEYDEKEGNCHPVFAPVGDGTLDFKKIVGKMKEVGAKYFFVEQDNAADLPDSLGLVERSVKYIKKEL